MDGAATIPDRHDQASPSSLRPTTLHSASAQSATSTRRALLAGDARPDAVDLSHHLSDMAKSRLTSPLKVRSFPLEESSSANCRGPVLTPLRRSLQSLYGYMQQPGMLLLAGGLPPAELFPFVRPLSSLLSQTTTTLQ